MVESQTSSKPHFVEMKKNGNVVCDGCPSFAAAKLCAHSIAASEKAGVLEKFLSWFMKNGLSSMNLTSFITYDSSKDTGEKLSKSSTGIRKGGRSRGAGPATTIVDQQFDRNNSSPQPHVQQPLMSSSRTVPQPPAHSTAAIVAHCAATALVQQHTPASINAVQVCSSTSGTTHASLTNCFNNYGNSYLKLAKPTAYSSAIKWDV